MEIDNTKHLLYDVCLDFEGRVMLVFPISYWIHFVLGLFHKLFSFVCNWWDFSVCEIDLHCNCCYYHIEFWIDVIGVEHNGKITLITLFTLPFFPIFGTMELIRKIPFKIKIERK